MSLTVQDLLIEAKSRTLTPVADRLAQDDVLGALGAALGMIPAQDRTDTLRRALDMSLGLSEVARKALNGRKIMSIDFEALSQCMILAGLSGMGLTEDEKDRILKWVRDEDKDHG